MLKSKKRHISTLQRFFTDTEKAFIKKSGGEYEVILNAMRDGFVYESMRTGMSATGWFFLTDAGKSYLKIEGAVCH